MKSAMIRLSFIAILAAGGLVFAQDMSQQQSVTGDSIIQVKGPIVESMNGNFSATFQSASPQEVFRVIGMQTGIQFMVSTRISGSITASFKETPIKDAMYALLSANNLYYIEQGSIVKILSLPEYKSELIRSQITTKVYDASIIDIKNLAIVIRTVLTPGVGNFIIDTQSSKIIVTDVKDNFERIDSLMNEIAALPKQVEIEIRIIKVDLKDGGEFGINWKALNIGIGDGTFNLNMNFIPTNNSSTGLNFSGTYPVQGATLDVIISALSTKYNTKIISQPKILALNRGEATIHIGERVPFVKSKVDNTTTTSTTSSVDFVDVGVKLNVSPTVTESNDIKIKLKAELSSAESYDIGNNEKAPKITTTMVDCETVCFQGYTMIIGGLISRSATTNRQKVPLLGDIPILDYFFSHKTEDVSETELIIFLTPRLIKPGASNLFMSTNTYRMMDEFTNSSYNGIIRNTNARVEPLVK